ncbi:MAG: alpha/beta fold hydrolase [Deltaproteobacteria bacterium]|nr:alpha/beta fold hydrolase [Deltaproteobacteria bacterium]
MSIFTKASAAIDRSVIRLMERQMAPRAPKIDPDARSRLVELAAAYGAGTLGHPSPFFPTPELPDVTLRSHGDGPLGTQIVDLTYPSTYVPFHPKARELLDPVTENAVAHARWWTSGSSKGGPSQRRPTIVFLHGWGGGNQWMTARTFVVPYWLRHGFDVAAFVLPFHGARAPESRSPMRSGALFPSPNPLRTNEGFGQAIHDLRALALWLRHRGASSVGVMGMSLGGYTTALWASIAGHEEAAIGGVDFAVAMIPAVSMARLMWRHGEANPTRRRAASAGITEELLEETFAVHAPLTRVARLPRERLAVIAGRGDRITPPDQAEALAAHWGVPISWFEGGHLAQVGRGDALRDVRRQLGTLGLVGRDFRS